MAEYRKQKELPQKCDKDANYLHNSEKSSTFVPAMNKMLGSKPRKS